MKDREKTSAGTSRDGATEKLEFGEAVNSCTLRRIIYEIT